MAVKDQKHFGKIAFLPHEREQMAGWKPRGGIIAPETIGESVLDAWLDLLY